MHIYLEFAQEQGLVEKTRLQYAFSLFCAIYGHHNVAQNQPGSEDVRITYLSTYPTVKTRPVLHLSNLYSPRSIRESSPPPKKFERGSEATVLFYAPVEGVEPDWLAEIFEWVSCADEYSIIRRDPEDRVRFGDSYVGRHGLDPGIPYAGVAMRFLHQALCKCLAGRWVEPEFPNTHFTVNTHDVDILPAGYFGSLQQLLRYSLISLLVFKSPGSAVVQASKAFLMAVGGKNPLDQSASLMQKEIENELGATYFFIARQAHRRDANYRIDDPSVLKLMDCMEQQGMEIALHGSYTSLDQPGGLASEFEILTRIMREAESAGSLLCYKHLVNRGV